MWEENPRKTYKRKFNWPFFSKQWNQIAARINTKCRGKRGTLFHRLKKTSLFWKHKDGTISLSFHTKNNGTVNWTELSIVQQNCLLSYIKCGYSWHINFTNYAESKEGIERRLENPLSAQNNALTNRLGDDSQRNKVWQIDCQLMKKNYIRYLMILFTLSVFTVTL